MHVLEIFRVICMIGYMHLPGYMYMERLCRRVIWVRSGLYGSIIRFIMQNTTRKRPEYYRFVAYYTDLI